ncbi:MAG: ATP-dependent DNA helicase [Burkholderiaceae bacterium]
MSLPFLVAQVFEEGGPLSKLNRSFIPRAGQTAMALAVAKSIADGGVLAVEAGTGVGKTFAYLVPALLSGKKILISTATKALQDQLYGRDLPDLVRALGVPLVTRLLKGRSNYLCLHRLPLVRHNLGSLRHADALALACIERWALTTSSGDMAEVSGLDERSTLLPWVTSTRDNCLGSPCPQFKSCHVNQARREAALADVLVINHHLFFADMAVRESGMAELLPAFEVAIFDEAHQLNETGIQFLGQHLGTAQLLDFGRDLLAAGWQQAKGLQDWQALAHAIEAAVRDFRLVARRVPLGSKLRWTGSAPEGLVSHDWIAGLAGLQSAVINAGQALEAVREANPDFDRLLARANDFSSRCQVFSLAAAADNVRWLDVTSHLRLVESPLDIAQAMQALVYPAEGDAAEQKTWLFTSATLAGDKQLQGFTEPLGLREAVVMQVDSPFDYPSQASLYVPRTWPPPGDVAHTERVTALVAQAAKQLGGRTMVLTTTLRAMHHIGDGLQQYFENAQAAIEVLVQGQWPKRELMRRFVLGSSQGGKGCVLVGSASFWEGVDIPGQALQLVVIDKLPFPPPTDPLVEARAKRHEAAGRSAFQHVFLPETAVALKQGAGRLIRRESDVGILVVCDTRLYRMGYGRQLLQALPPMRPLGSEAEFDEAVQGLTRISTTDS